MYSKSNQQSESGSTIKNLTINDLKHVSINQVGVPIANRLVETPLRGTEIKVRILARDYVIPHSQFSKEKLEPPGLLCEKELLRFLGSRSFASGSYVLDYLDHPPLHTVFVADKLKACKVIRLCRSSEEAGFVRSMCKFNEVSNVVALSPDDYQSGLLDKTQELLDKLTPRETANSQLDVRNTGILLLGAATRKDIDAHLRRWFDNTKLPLSIFEIEEPRAQTTWHVRKPTNIYSFGSAKGFSRSDFALGAYAPRQPGLDIAVAMYNTPKYIVDCVDSLISIDRDDINVIIVNDGSIDNSLEVVTQRYSNHPRVKIITKKNGGCASARNYGRMHSNRTHITFVDSDDFTDRDMFAKLYDLSLYTGAEVTQGGFDFYHEGAEQEYIPSYEDALFANYHRQEFRGQQIIRVNADDLICGQPTIWRRVYRRDFLDAKRIYFPENIRAYDDYIFHTLSIYYARDVFMIPEIKMHYRQHAAQDIKQGDERHFYEIYMFKQLLRRSLEEGWPHFSTCLPSIFNSMHWSLQTLRDNLIKPFAHAAANFIWCVEKVYGSAVTANLNLSAIKVEQFHEELSRMRMANQDWNPSYVWAYIESIDNHPITLTMQNAVK